jgi:hypothetical protein
MPNPRQFRTGNPAIDRQNREFASATSGYTAEVVISGQSGPVIKRVPHMLGREPSSFSVARSMPSNSAIAGPQEVTGGYWGRDAVDIEFGGNGTWFIRFS